MSNLFATDVLQPEGPVCLADGRVFAVEMDESRACITEFRPDGTRRSFRVPGRPNGLTIDGNGRLWLADRRKGIFCFSQDGRLLRQIEINVGRDLLWANDLRFGPDGHLYVTDSGIREKDFTLEGGGARPDHMSLEYNGCVFEIDPMKGVAIRTIGNGLKMANGLAFGLDGALYVNETITGEILHYNVFGTYQPRAEPFAQVISDDAPDGHRGPDGMAFGTDGILYCTVFVQGEIVGVNISGDVVSRFKTEGTFPTNIAFLPGKATALVTEVTKSAIEVVDLPAYGMPIHAPVFELR